MNGGPAVLLPGPLDVGDLGTKRRLRPNEMPPLVGQEDDTFTCPHRCQSLAAQIVKCLAVGCPLQRGEGRGAAQVQVEL